jgi:hypothetical protein
MTSEEIVKRLRYRWQRQMDTGAGESILRQAADHIEQLERNNRLLTFMVEHGIGPKDMEMDI